QETPSQEASYSEEDQHLAIVIQHTQHQQHTQYQYHHQRLPTYIPTAYDIELELAQQQLLLRQHEERHRQLHQSYIYELQDRLAMLQFNGLDSRPRHPPLAIPIADDNSALQHRLQYNRQPPPLFFMRYMQSDDNYNNTDYSLPPPPAFRYDSPSSYSRSLSYTDASYDSMNSSNNTNNNNNEAGSLISSVFDENDYDDVDDDEIPKKGLLKQMFCLPLN
ncbi:G-box-binding factor-like, partial [Copidosoma floridanum]|uniref:G-box-binding factor-like n=1 Tax=Copidosoma floridanum TaxID=29053 RepID=UPI000C6F6C7F